MVPVPKLPVPNLQPSSASAGASVWVLHQDPNMNPILNTQERCVYKHLYIWVHARIVCNTSWKEKIKGQFLNPSIHPLSHPIHPKILFEVPIKSMTLTASNSRHRRWLQPAPLLRFKHVGHCGVGSRFGHYLLASAALLCFFIVSNCGVASHVRRLSPALMFSVPI